MGVASKVEKRLMYEEKMKGTSQSKLEAMGMMGEWMKARA